MDKDIIQSAADEVGKRIGKLQGKLFAVKTKAKVLEAEIQHLDSVYQSFLGQLKAPQEHVAVPSLTKADVRIALSHTLPQLDPSSVETCLSALDLISYEDETTTKAAISVMEGHGWKQGEAIALAQKVVQHLRG